MLWNVSSRILNWIPSSFHLGVIGLESLPDAMAEVGKSCLVEAVGKVIRERDSFEMGFASRL